MSDDPQPAPTLPSAGSEHVGSTRLRAALVARDVEAIGRALRMDVVVVPLLRDPDTADAQIQVIGVPGEEPGTQALELHLFSSSAAYARFILDAPQRSFSLQRGEALATFLAANHAALDRVVFDGAEDHAMAASPADVLAALEPQPGDDDVAWLLGDAAAPSPAPARRSRGLFGRRRRDGGAPLA